MIKTEFDAQNECFKNSFFDRQIAENAFFLPGIVFVRVNYPRNTDEFFSNTAVFSVVIPLTIWLHFSKNYIIQGRTETGKQEF